MAGTFTQTVAQSWLVLKLTGSGAALGLLTVLQYTPILLLGGAAGVLVDRMDRRRIYMLTQGLAGIEALVLGILTVTGTVELWQVYVLALVLGLITAVDQPVRQSIVFDLVGPTDITNAVSLNMAMLNSSRVVGPAIAGVTIAVLGVGPCFLVNAASFVAVIIALLAMRPQDMYVAPIQPRKRRQFREGLTYVRGAPDLMAILAMTAVFFGLAWQFDVILPLTARFTFKGGAGLYGALTAALGLGSVVGGLAVASRSGGPTNRLLVTAGIAFGVATLGAAIAPDIALELVTLLVVGVAGMAVAAIANAKLQLGTRPAMRGRVFALWSAAAVGTRPVGGLVAGVVGQHLGPRIALLLAAAAVAVALPLWAVLARAGSRPSGRNSPESRRMIMTMAMPRTIEAPAEDGVAPYEA